MLFRSNQGRPNFILTQNPTQEEFEEALESLLNNPNLIEANRALIVENFSLVAMGEKIMQIYRNLLTNP